MQRGITIACAFLAALTACARVAPARGDAPPIVVTFGTPTRDVIIDDLRLADTEPERQRGLMGVTSLPRLGGMAFLWDTPVTDGAFWMKETPIPLSVVFWDTSGRIYAELDMEPCRADPCRLYKPGGAFVGAIEMNVGAFAKLGIGIGDTVGYTLAGS